MVPASLNDRFVIRFCVCAQNACEEDILFAYETISQFASNLLEIVKASEMLSVTEPGKVLDDARVIEEEDEDDEEDDDEANDAQVEKLREDEIFGMEKADEEGKDGKDDRLEDKDDNEFVDKVIVLDRRKKTSLRYKRSFFVRMVSDPKLYNPKIVKALSTSNDQTSDDNDNNEIFSPI